MAGLPQAGDELVIRQSDPNSVSVLSVGSDRLNAIQCVNSPRDYMMGRKLVALRDGIPLAPLLDPATQLKDLL